MVAGPVEAPVTHRDTMVALVHARGWTDGVELGVAHGHLFERLLTECPALRRLTGVDLGRRPERRARVLSVEARFPWRATMLWCSTNAAADLVPDGSVDFVFVDAGHGYRSVSSDIARWRTKVRPGGWFGGHDYCPQFPGVIQAVDEAFGGRIGHLPDTIWFVRDESLARSV